MRDSCGSASKQATRLLTDDQSVLRSNTSHLQGRRYRVLSCYRKNLKRVSMLVKARCENETLHPERGKFDLLNWMPCYTFDILFMFHEYGHTLEVSVGVS